MGIEKFSSSACVLIFVFVLHSNPINKCKTVHLLVFLHFNSA